MLQERSSARFAIEYQRLGGQAQQGSQGLAQELLGASSAWRQIGNLVRRQIGNLSLPVKA